MFSASNQAAPPAAQVPYVRLKGNNKENAQTSNVLNGNIADYDITAIENQHKFHVDHHFLNLQGQIFCLVIERHDGKTSFHMLNPKTRKADYSKQEQNDGYRDSCLLSTGELLLVTDRLLEVYSLSNPIRCVRRADWNADFMQLVGVSGDGVIVAKNRDRQAGNYNFQFFNEELNRLHTSKLRVETSKLVKLHISHYGRLCVYIKAEGNVKVHLLDGRAKTEQEIVFEQPLPIREIHEVSNREFLAKIVPPESRKYRYVILSRNEKGNYVINQEKEKLINIPEIDCEILDAQQYKVLIAREGRMGDRASRIDYVNVYDVQTQKYLYDWNEWPISDPDARLCCEYKVHMVDERMLVERTHNLKGKTTAIFFDFSVYHRMAYLLKNTTKFVPLRTDEIEKVLNEMDDDAIGVKKKIGEAPL